jgi:hypothetical protein
MKMSTSDPTQLAAVAFKRQMKYRAMILMGAKTATSRRRSRHPLEATEKDELPLRSARPHVLTCSITFIFSLFSYSTVPPGPRSTTSHPSSCDTRRNDIRVPIHNPSRRALTAALSPFFCTNTLRTIVHIFNFSPINRIMYGTLRYLVCSIENKCAVFIEDLF